MHTVVPLKISALSKSKNKPFNYKTPMGRDLEFEIEFYEGILKRAPKYIDVIEILGGLYTKKGRVDDGLRMDRKLVRLMPDNPTAHYNLACSLSLKRRKADAIRALEKAIDFGYNDYEWMRDDPDLSSLQEHPAFKNLLKRIREI